MGLLKTFHRQGCCGSIRLQTDYGRGAGPLGTIGAFFHQGPNHSDIAVPRYGSYPKWGYPI